VSHQKLTAGFPTAKPRYVHAWIDRKGPRHQYFRRKGYPRVRLPGLPGSAEFERVYNETLLAGPRHFPRSPKSSVYFAKIGRAIKIGVTTDLKKRLANIKGMSADDVLVRAFIALAKEATAIDQVEALERWYRRSPAERCLLNREFDHGARWRLRRRRKTVEQARHDCEAASL
jgi:hypothetical protein